MTNEHRKLRAILKVTRSRILFPRLRSPPPLGEVILTTAQHFFQPAGVSLTPLLLTIKVNTLHTTLLLTSFFAASRDIRENEIEGLPEGVFSDLYSLQEL